MSPSSMELRNGTMQDYNNEIVIATNIQDLGLNHDVNVKPVSPKQTQTVQGTATKQSHPNLDYRKQVIDYAKAHNLPQSWIDGCSAEPGDLTRWVEGHKKYSHSLQPSTTTVPPSINEHHENNKTALIVGSIVVDIIAITLYKLI